MKLLQGLVPGCDKVNFTINDICVLLPVCEMFHADSSVWFEKQVTGKALMLDEIINYVQSLQNQVEVMSMDRSQRVSVIFILFTVFFHYNEPFGV